MLAVLDKGHKRQRTPPAARVASDSGHFRPPALQKKLVGCHAPGAEHNAPPFKFLRIGGESVNRMIVSGNYLVGPCKLEKWIIMPFEKFPVTLVPILLAVIVAMLFIFYVPAGGDLISSRGDMVLGGLDGLLFVACFFIDLLRFGKHGPKRPGILLSPAPSESVRVMANAGGKIAAIKLYRDETGLGPREAKEAVDSCLMTPKSEPSSAPELASTPAKHRLFGLLAVVCTVVVAAITFHSQDKGQRDSYDYGQRASGIKSQVEGLKARTDVNSARMAELAVRLNTHAVNCESPKGSDDLSVQACHELNQKEEDAILNEMAASVKETSAIRGALDAVQKDLDALANKSGK